MKKLILLLLFVGFSAIGDTTTEFYIDTAAGAANTNSGQGGVTGGSYSVTPAFSSVGFWTNTGAVFYQASLNPVGFSVGDWASVFTNLATKASFIAKVTATNSTTITLSTTIIGGTDPVNDTAGYTHIVIGGAWAGPNTNSSAGSSDLGFPINIMAYTMTNTGSPIPRVNWKAGNYYITNNITTSFNGPFIIQGYTTTPGDGGRPVLWGLAAPSGSGYEVLTLAGNFIYLADIGITNSQSAGTGANLNMSGTPDIVKRVWAAGSRGPGIQTVAAAIIECEAFGNGRSSGAGISSGTGSRLIRCYSHNQAGTSAGFTLGNNTAASYCISANNGGKGFLIQAGTIQYIDHCDAWNNGQDNIDNSVATASMLYAENNHVFKSGAYGIDNSGSATLHLFDLVNNSFGTGNVTNTSGFIISGCPYVSTYLTNYAANATPWTDPTNANFNIASTSQTKAAGRGFYLQSTAANVTVGYPDIGAAQSSSTNATTTTTSGGSYTFAQ